MKTFSATALTTILTLLTTSTLSTPLPDVLTDDFNSTSLDTRQAAPQTVEVTICNKYNGFCGGAGADCHSVTLVSGTYASTPGTTCWYLPGSPHPPPTSVGNIVFCNSSGGGGKCHQSQDCAIASDGSCDASGTESMGYNA